MANDRGTVGISPGRLSWRDCDAGISLAGIVRPSVLGDCYSPGAGGARFLISPEESGLAVLGENRACGFRQCVQLHVSILSRRIATKSRAFIGFGVVMLCAAGLRYEPMLACAVRPPVLDDWYSSGAGGARFLPRSSRYMASVHVADHSCDRVYSGVILVARAHVLTTRITVAVYSRLTSTVQAWNRAGLRIVVLPWLSVMVRVLPRRACFDMVSSSVVGLVSSARYQTCFGSHVMSSMLMVVSFPATFVASNRGSGSLTRLLVVVGSRCRSYPCRFRASSPARRLALVGQEETRFLPRSSRYMVSVHAADHSCGLCVSDVVEFPLQELVGVDPYLMYGFLDGYDRYAVRQWFEGVEAVPRVHVGDVPPVDGAVGSGCFEGEHDHILSRRIATNDGAFAGLGLLGYVACGGIAARAVRACAVRPFPVSDEFQSSDTGGDVFPATVAWYARFVWSAVHMVRAVVCAVALYRFVERLGHVQ